MYQIDDWREVIKMPVINPRAWSLRGLQEALVSSIRNCIQFCLKQNDGNLIMTLSGGLDSTLFLGVARNQFPDIEIKTFTIVRELNHPDMVFAKRATQTFNALDYWVHCTPQMIAEGIDEFEAAFPNILYRSGDIAVFILFKQIPTAELLKIKKSRFVVCLDGIDELHGGYWAHRMHKTPEQTELAFKDLWKELGPNHLEKLTRSAGRFGITPIFPYLQWEFVEYSSWIPVSARTSREESKILIRQIARNFGVPEEIVARPKVGFCDALTPAETLEAKLAERR